MANRIHSIKLFTTVLGIFLSTTSVKAQFSYPGCSDLKSTDFSIKEVFNNDGGGGASGFDNGIAEPVQMDLHGVKKNGVLDHVDIYFVERLGGVKMFDGATKTVVTLGKIPTLGLVDNGLMGLALDPDFDNNRNIFFWYSPKELVGQNRKMRLTRIKLLPNNTLDMVSEKILIEILGSKSDKYHSGGPMTFDSYGDLWVTVGNNSPDLDIDTCNVKSRTDSTKSAEWGPSNTASLRGGIFRIHPDNSTKGYSIPGGNFGEYWANQFDSQGRTALATEYRNPVKVLPELYVKGDRSNFSIAVHPTKRWLAWGVVNYSTVNDEFNLVTHPVFAGYPYFHQNNLPTCRYERVETVDAPVNNSPFNSGVVNLPPATPSVISNLVNVAMSGPIYVFDPSLNIPTKFPPHLHQSWINMSFQSNQIYISTLDTINVTVKKTQRVDNGLFVSKAFRHPLQAKYGPDGSLYVLNYDGFYSTGIPGVFKIDYVGGCQIVSNRAGKRINQNLDISISPSMLYIREEGEHALQIYDVKGNLRATHRSSHAADYSLQDIGLRFGLEQGVYQFQVKTTKGIFNHTFFLL